MDIKPYKISLDFYIRKIITVNAKQLDDKARVINITCTENGKKFFVDASILSAFVRYKKSDGYAVLNQVDILEDGTVNLVLTQQMLAVEGRHLVDIMLIDKSELDVFTENISVTDDGNGNVTVLDYETKDISNMNVEEILTAISSNGIKVLSTMSFYINTEGVVIDNCSDIESSYEYNSLIEYWGKMVAVDNKMSTLDNKMSTLEQTINNNETQRQTNEQSRQIAESERVGAELTREIAENGEYDEDGNLIKDGRVQAEEKRINAETQRIDAEKLRDIAENGEFDEEGNLIKDGRVQTTQKVIAMANEAVTKCQSVIDKGGIVLKTDIIHDLETEDENKVPDATQVKILKDEIDDINKFIAKISLPDSASTHNAIFRGEDLTSKYTVDEICERISSGTFEDLYIGDYFDITFTNPNTFSEETMRCILAAFDYYYNQYTYGCTKHHAVIIPKNHVGGNYGMNVSYDNHLTEGGYTGSEMFESILPKLVTPLQTALNNHIITYKNYLASAVNTEGNSAAGAGMVGYASSATWEDVTITIPNEIQVYGTQVWCSSPYNVGLDTTILPLFAHNPMARVCGEIPDAGEATDGWWGDWWLRDVVSADHFASVDLYGLATFKFASDYYVKLRPLFLIG